MFAPNLNSPVTRLHLETESSRVSFELRRSPTRRRRGGKEEGGGGRIEREREIRACESISYFDRISAKEGGENVSRLPSSPGIGKKQSENTRARNETYPRDIESRYRSRPVAKIPEFSPFRRLSLHLFLLFLLLEATLHFNALRGEPGRVQQYPLPPPPPPFNLFYFIRHSRHEQGRIPVRGSTRPINSCKTCTHR